MGERGHVGGLVGSNSGSVSASYATGAVSGTGGNIGTQGVGGFNLHEFWGDNYGQLLGH